MHLQKGQRWSCAYIKIAAPPCWVGQGPGRVRHVQSVSLHLQVHPPEPGAQQWLGEQSVGGGGSSQHKLSPGICAWHQNWDCSPSTHTLLCFPQVFLLCFCSLTWERESLFAAVLLKGLGLESILALGKSPREQLVDSIPAISVHSLDRPSGSTLRGGLQELIRQGNLSSQLGLESLTQD